MSFPPVRLRCLVRFSLLPIGVAERARGAPDNELFARFKEIIACSSKAVIHPCSSSAPEAASVQFLKPSLPLSITIFSGCAGFRRDLLTYYVIDEVLFLPPTYSRFTLLPWMGLYITNFSQIVCSVF